MFIDQAIVYLRSGKGGDGFVHFHREKYVARGGPDGGDGGRGGDVILQVEPRMNTLSSFRRKTKFIARDGTKGGINNMTGKSADDLVILVPPGTLVYNDATAELLADLVEPGFRFRVCKGGRGGRGNQHFASPRNQAPRMAEKGEPAQEFTIRFELKLIADVGLVGVPNAGKSSLLAAVTNARPKIAEYPFTTLEPNLGVAELDLDTQLILADIPGLIEGAHQGVGLGDAFLRHVQRTRVLIHILDGLAEDPVADYSQTNNELALFDPALGEKPQIVVFNKMDLPEVQDRWKDVKAQLNARGVEVYPISAMARTNLRDLLWQAVELLRTAPEPQPTTQVPVYRPAVTPDPTDFSIRRENERSWRVEGDAIERAAAMTFWEYEGSVRRFQRLMERLGVEAALRKAGVQPGDTVFIGEYELEWQE